MRVSGANIFWLSNDHLKFMLVLVSDFILCNTKKKRKESKLECSELVVETRMVNTRNNLFVNVIETEVTAFILCNEIQALFYILPYCDCSCFVVFTLLITVA